MEGIGRKLRGDHRRGDVDTLIENLQQFPGGRNGDRAKVEIIEHEQIHLAIEIHHIAMAPVSSGESVLLDEVAGPIIPHRHLASGGFGSYHASQKGLASSSSPRGEHAMGTAHPSQRDQIGKCRSGDSPIRLEGRTPLCRPQF